MGQSARSALGRAKAGPERGLSSISGLAAEHQETLDAEARKSCVRGDFRVNYSRRMWRIERTDGNGWTYPMHRPAGSAIVFGAFRLAPANARLLRDGRPVAITPKSFDVLHDLAGRPDR